MKDRDFFVVYRYEFDTQGGERHLNTGVHIFTSTATTRWELYMDHIQHRRDRDRQDGTPWAEVPRLIVHTFDAKINKLS